MIGPRSNFKPIRNSSTISKSPKLTESPDGTCCDPLLDHFIRRRRELQAHRFLVHAGLLSQQPIVLSKLDQFFFCCHALTLHGSGVFGKPLGDLGSYEYFVCFAQLILDFVHYPFEDLLPFDKPIQITGTYIWHIVDGKVLEHWGNIPITVTVWDDDQKN